MYRHAIRSIRSTKPALCAIAAMTLLLVPMLASPALADEVTSATTDEIVYQPALCFGPGTSDEYVREMTSRYARGPLPLLQASSLSKFQLTNRWSITASDGSGLVQGDPTTITWSYVPDGTIIPGSVGEPDAPSNLFAWLNGIYGNFATWHALFVQVFDRWAELTGNTYVYEPNDDGAQFPDATPPPGIPGAPGLLGVRGDVRIGAHFINGFSGILAYNFFPNVGDMVLDSADAFYNDTSGNSLRLRNVLAHEHGHGMGLRHVCPINQTKLMEPFFSSSFDGPQFDDILGAQRHYGDFFEHNDTSATATAFGFLPSGTMGFEDELSVDDNSDTNFYTFTTDTGQQATIQIAPPGVTPYPSGPQNPVNGQCDLPTPIFDPNTIHDLNLSLLAPDGTTVIASADANPAGGTETVSVALPNGAGPYFVQVGGDTTNNIQAYELDLDLTPVGCTQIEGPTSGRWNLPPAGGSAVGVEGALESPPGTTVYKITATLTETSATGGTLVGTLRDGVSPDPDWAVRGTYTITVPPDRGTFSARIFPLTGTTAVGKIGGRWRDNPNTAITGAYRGEWKICN